MKKDLFFRGKPVATVRDGTLRKTISQGNIFRLSNSLSVAKSIIIQATDYGALRIQIRIRETGDVYETTIEKLINDGYLDDNGLGEHYYLAIPKWKKINDNDDDQNNHTQLSMFN